MTGAGVTAGGTDAAPLDQYALYRYFDGRDALLYIGITGDLANRDDGHISRSRWMQLVASSKVGRYPDREMALKAERAAIETEHPLFNVQYNNTPAARARLRAYLEEIGRMDLYKPRVRNVPMGELEMIKARKVRRGSQPVRAPESAGEDHVLDRRLASRDEVVLMCTAALQDSRLSLAARGLLALVLSLTSRETTTEWLAASCPDGEDAVQGALGELEACGYCRDGVISDAPRETIVNDKDPSRFLPTPTPARVA